MFQEMRERSLIYAATAPDDPMETKSVATQTKGGSKKTIVTRAVLGSDAGLYGAARVLAIQG
jgi:hypothetical protein